MSVDGLLEDMNNTDKDLFKPHENDWLKNKFEYYETIRNLDTLYYSKQYNMFVITDYNNVLHILKNPEIYGSIHGNLIIENPDRFNNTLGASDGAIHEEFKNSVKNSYSKNFGDFILNYVKPSVINELRTNTTLDITKLSIYIASLVTTKLLGFPEQEEKVVKVITHIQNNAAQCVKYNTNQKGYNKLLNIIGENMAKKVKPDKPGIYMEYVSDTKNRKTIALFTGPTVSGAASLAGAIQFLVLDLFRNNKLNELIANKALISNAVQESLRYNASTGRFTRTANKTTVIKNTEVRANSRLVVCLDAASRDPQIFSNPNSFDLNRPSYPHLAFGHGVHACIALYLSKIVLEFFLDSLLTVYGKYRVIDIENLQYTITQSGNNDMLANLVIEKYDS